jgi:hypothetical protein
LAVEWHPGQRATKTPLLFCGSALALLLSCCNKSVYICCKLFSIKGLNLLHLSGQQQQQQPAAIIAASLAQDHPANQPKESLLFSLYTVFSQAITEGEIAPVAGAFGAGRWYNTALGIAMICHLDAMIVLCNYMSPIGQSLLHIGSEVTVPS